MKNIFGIYNRDIRKFGNNYITIIILLGLLILPSLYAWINIIANWDPYNNTSHIEVAVVNNDVGTKLANNNFNIGNVVVEKLKANDQIGWEFMDQQTASQGLNAGKYYAMVEIPRDFSQKIASITTANIERPQINYTVNEKKNAIAPKVTGQGVTVIQEEINKEFIKAVSQGVLAITGLIDDTVTGFVDDSLAGITTGLSKTSTDIDTLILILDNVQNGTSMASGSIKSVTSSLDNFGTTLNTIQKDTAKNQQLILDGRDQAKISIANLQNQISQAKTTINLMATQVDNALAMVDSGLDGAVTILNQVSAIGSKLMTANNDILSVLQSLNNGLPIRLPGVSNLIDNLNKQNNELGNINNAIDQATNNIRTNQTVSKNNSNEIYRNLKLLSTQSTDNWNTFVNTVSPQLDSVVNSTYNGLGKVVTTLNRTVDNIPQTKEMLNNFSNGLSDGNNMLSSTKKLLLSTKSSIDKLNNDIKTTPENEKMGKLVEIIKNDPNKISDFLSSPVKINEAKIYPIANNGSAMTPFYTVLCFWVGVLILMALISTKIREDMKYYNLTHSETYFGRLLLILTLVLGQATIACLGDLFILQIYCVNKVMFMITGIVTAIVFGFIVFTLVSTFGNVGKAIAVILLVFQVAAAGGTFPSEMLPLAMRIINPLLPFTYAIDAMRETIGGIYTPAYIKDMLVLLIYIPISLSIAIVFRTRMMKMMDFFEKKTHETGFIE